MILARTRNQESKSILREPELSCMCFPFWARRRQNRKKLGETSGLITQSDKLEANTRRGLRSILSRSKADRDEERGGRSKHSGLLRGHESRIPVYGYRNERYGDGTSESETSGRTTLIHRDDCEGICGQPRRRSAD
jgi:hypothetical protein